MERERFAPVRIDDPVATPSDSETATPSRIEETPSKGFWQRLASIGRGGSTSYDSVRYAIAPEGGAPYRMVAMPTLLEKLKIRVEDPGYLDDHALESLRSRLKRMGLTTATTISGPLRLRYTDSVPVVELGRPLPSRYSSITICMYLIAWLLEADGATQRDLDIVDDWIERYDPSGGWAEAAKGTLRWLLSRRLVLTRKRKQRTGRIRRYPNVRSRLLEVLLALVSDPEYASPKRMKRLETIYTAIDLDPAEIHSDLHRLATSANPAAPKRRRTAIDNSRLDEMARSTLQAQELLAGVFAETGEKTPETTPTATSNRAENLIALLASRGEWTRKEAEDIAAAAGMTLGAMLEKVNDLSFEVADDVVAEDEGETIYINTDIAAQCQNNRQQ